jgi:hypothetical protein
VDAEALTHFQRSYPRVAGDQFDDRREYSPERCSRFRIGQARRPVRGNKGPHIREKGGVGEFCEHALLRLCPQDAMARSFKIQPKALDDARGLEIGESLQALIEVE